MCKWGHLACRNRHGVISGRRRTAANGGGSICLCERRWGERGVGARLDIFM